MSEEENKMKMNRRGFLGALGAAATAGCSSLRGGSGNGGTATDTETDTTTPGSSITATVGEGETLVYSDLTGSDITRLQNWQQNKFNDLEWSEVQERRNDLLDETSQVEESLESDLGLKLPLNPNTAVGNYRSGQLVYEEVVNDENNLMILADTHPNSDAGDHGNNRTFERTNPEAIWPNFQNEHRRSIRKPENRGMNTNFRKFLESAGLPDDNVSGPNNQALGIMSRVVPYLGDVGDADGLQVTPEFFDTLVGEEDDGEGLLDEAVERVNEIEEEWNEYLTNHWQDDSVTNYKRELVGRDGESGVFGNVISLLEDPSESDLETVSDDNYSGERLEADRDYSGIIQDLDEERQRIIREFRADRQRAANVSMISQVLEVARDEIERVREHYELEEETPSDDDNDDNGDEEDDTPEETDTPDGTEYEWKEFSATYDHRGGIQENTEELIDDKGREGLYDLFAEYLHNYIADRQENGSKTDEDWITDLVPGEEYDEDDEYENQVERIDGGKDFTLNYLEDFFDGFAAPPEGDGVGFKFEGEIKVEEENNDPDYWEIRKQNLDSITMEVLKEYSDHEEDRDMEMKSGFEDYVMDYFGDDNLEIEIK